MDDGPLSCISCKEPLDNGYPCLRCHCTGEEVPVESLGEDEDSEEAVHRAESADALMEAIAERDIAEELQLMLEENDIPEDIAVIASQVLADIWETAHPLTIEEYSDELGNREDLDEELLGILQDETVRGTILQKLWEIYEGSDEGGHRPLFTIRIFRNPSNEWDVEVDHPVQGVVLTDTPTLIEIAPGIFKSSHQYLRDMENKADRLKRVGLKLLKFRTNFFEAKTEEKAMQILKTEQLEQKVLAKEVDVAPSTLNKWVHDEGIMLHTHFGMISLDKFFSRATTKIDDHKVTKKRHLSKAGMKKIIDELESLNTKNMLAELESKHGIMMSDRTLRDYVQEMKENSVT